MNILNRVHGKPPLVFKEKIWRHTYQLLPLLIRINHDPDVCVYMQSMYTHINNVYKLCIHIHTYVT